MSDHSLCINLRNRKVSKFETDPDRRCEIVSGWPAESRRPTITSTPADTEQSKQQTAQLRKSTKQTTRSTSLSPTRSLSFSRKHSPASFRSVASIALPTVKQPSKIGTAAVDISPTHSLVFAERSAIKSVGKTLPPVESCIIDIEPTPEDNDSVASDSVSASDTNTESLCPEDEFQYDPIRVPIFENSPPSEFIQPSAPTPLPSITANLPVVEPPNITSIRQLPQDIEFLNLPASSSTEYTLFPQSFRPGTTIQHQNSIVPPTPAINLSSQLISPVLVPTSAVSMASQQVVHTISDSLIAPKPFEGRADEDAEFFVNYFERYSAYRGLNDINKLHLFGILLHGGAADWLSTLSSVDTATYASLLAVFKANYFKSEQLRWKEASELWNQPQGPTERVDDFITRIRRAARRLNITEDMLHYAVLNGLRSPIRCHVLQQGVKNLQATIDAARIAESSVATDPLTALLMENIKATSLAAEKQAADLRELSVKVSALSAAASTSASSQNVIHTPVASADSRYNQTDNRSLPRSSRNYNQRPVKQTPQRLQRQNYVRMQLNRQSDRTPTTPLSPAQGVDCTRCGAQHTNGACRADGQVCRRCGKMNHFARVCRSARVGRD